MRTTLTIDDDVLLAVKERARQEGRSAGDVLSALARRELTRQPAADDTRTRNGLPLLPRAGKVVSNDLVNQLREEENL
ncbi:MAG: antitoxin [Tessaracoccus sp.]|uniref:hypothetical protein n=1 Tax=Tessaracoccus sp. TaxID=1971211 RepID=UPI001ED0B660|nr:hypothetical protein [Tessaracoccus sp.]MBK7821887.1 antitoxin [Tessaracoccus sp.]